MYIPDAALDMFIQEMTATGGVMIMAIGLKYCRLNENSSSQFVAGDCDSWRNRYDIVCFSVNDVAKQVLKHGRLSYS